jgi:hypothetical protein
MLALKTIRNLAIKIISLFILFAFNFCEHSLEVFPASFDAAFEKPYRRNSQQVDQQKTAARLCPQRTHHQAFHTWAAETDSAYGEAISSQ